MGPFEEYTEHNDNKCCLDRNDELTRVSFDPVQLGEGLCCVGVDVADHLVLVTVREADDEGLVLQH